MKHKRKRNPTMTTATRTNKENEIFALTRTLIKKNGIVVWGVQSESGHEYRVTLFEGKVSSCERTDNEPCRGFQYRHTCHHAALIQGREDAYKLPAASTSELPYMPPLNGNRPFNLLKV
jgi:hypothetical protein